MAHSFENWGTFYVGEPLKVGNSKTLVLESYPWDSDLLKTPESQRTLRPCMIILTKILHIFIGILIKCIPFGIEIFVSAQN